MSQEANRAIKSTYLIIVLRNIGVRLIKDINDVNNESILLYAFGEITLI